jgi:tyrosine-protein kinase Etk/Wzc
MSDQADRIDLNLPHAGQHTAPEGLNLLPIVAAMVVEWRLAAITCVIVTLLGVGVTYSIKSEYVATATILPESDRAHSQSIADYFSARSPGGLFIGLLQSRAVADDIIDRLHLEERYHLHSREQTRAVLATESKFSVGGDSILVISIRERNAQAAADLANAYVLALNDLNVSMTQEESRELKSFYEGELGQERDDLLKAETALAQKQQKTGFIQPEAQTQIGLNSIAATRAQITALQVQLAALLQSATNQNPEVERLRTQIAELQAEERTQEIGTGAVRPGAAPAAGQMPQGDLDILRAQRDVRYHDSLVTALADQFEAARLGEGTSRPAFEIIDRAVAPERKSWPPRRIFVEVAFCLGVLLGIFAVVLKLLFRRIMSDPENRASLEVIRGVLHVR